MPLSRRDFLIRSGSLVAAAALPAATIPPRHLLSRRTARVLVVGAGPAGLAAAWELTLAGHDVRVFEARPRPGGRMHTLREPFSDGLYAEAGALNLLSTNPGLDYAREFGLDLVPLRFDGSLGTIDFLRGRRVVHRPDTPGSLPGDLHPDERGMSVSQLQTKYYRAPVAGLDGLDRLNDDAYPQDDVRPWDATSMLAYWQSLGASPDAIEFMAQRYFPAYGRSLDQANLLQIAREMASFTQVTGGFRIAGGNDRICRALARHLGDRVTLSSPVRAVRETGDRVTIAVDGPSGAESAEGDFAILTPPPPVLLRLVFDPELPSAMRRGLEAAVGDPVTRVFVQTRTRFWTEQGLDGGAVTDTPLGSIQDETAQQEGTRGILGSMTYGRRAEALASHPAEQRVELLRTGIQQIFPGAPTFEAAGASVAWGADPWSLGGHVSWRPGTLVDSLRAIREAHGRVHFAGDTVGGIPGYSNAAFTSGRATAATVAARA